MLFSWIISIIFKFSRILGRHIATVPVSFMQTDHKNMCRASQKNFQSEIQEHPYADACVLCWANAAVKVLQGTFRQSKARGVE